MLIKIADSLVLLLLLTACGRRDRAGAADSASVEPTPPDTITALDTLGPTPPSPMFRAFGNEPFWALDVDSGGFRFITPEDTIGLRFAPVTPILAGDSLRWTTLGDSGTLELIVRRQACSDGMSDSTWSHSARVAVRGTRYAGCARALR